MAIDSFIFGGNTGLTYEQLKRRRAVALALASQRRGFPKTIGEGMTYLGESIGDMLAERRLDAAEQEMQARRDRIMGGVPGSSAAPAAAPVTSPAAPRPPTPTPVRPPAAPMPPRPAPAAPPAAAAGPAPSITAIPVRPDPGDPYGATEGTGAGFAPGEILNPAPMAAPGLQETFPGEEGAREVMAGPSSGYLPPAATAAAPPSTSPAPAAAPTAPISPELQRAQEFQRSLGRPATNAAGVPLDGAPSAPPAAPVGPQSGLQDFIAKQEGYRPTAYWDYKQYSIGHGTRGQPGETITREEAGRRLESEVANARQSVEAFAPDAPEGIKNALTSLTYNAGPGWQQAGLGRAVREGNWEEARQRFLQYNKAGGSTLPGLVSRRNAELNTFWDQDGSDTLAGGTQFASLAPTGGTGAPIPGMGGAGAPRLRPQIPPLQGPPPAPEETGITPTDIEPMPRTAQFGPPTNRFTRTDAPVPGVTALPAPAPPPAPAAPQAPQGPSPAARPIVSEDLTKPLPEPAPPAYPDKLTPEEEYGWRMQAASGGDPAIEERAKQWIANGKARRDAEYLRQVELYKADIQFVRQENAARLKYQREAPETEQKLRTGEEALAGKRRAQEQEARLGGIPVGDFVKTIEKSHEGVKNIPTSNMALENARRSLIDEKMFTGSSAEMNLSMSKVLRAAGFPADPRVEATEQFKAYVAPIVAQARQALAGGANISDRDMMAAERAAAGNILLERDSIKGVLDSVGRINKAMAVSHQEKLRAFAGDDPNAQRIFDLYGLPVEQIVPVPPAAVEKLRANANNPQAYKDFDEAFGMPGLARRYVPRR